VSRWLAPGVALLAAAWLLLIVAAPVLWIPVAGVMYAAGSFICHQLPERSFHFQGAQLPVCARCLGLYCGGAFGSVLGANAVVRRRISRGQPFLARALRWRWTLAAAIPTLATLLLEWGFGLPISNTARAVAALPFGVAVAFVVVSAAATVHYE
jgi:Predicted membrane protein (DUF2085)